MDAANSLAFSVLPIALAACGDPSPAPDLPAQVVQPTPASTTPSLTLTVDVLEGNIRLNGEVVDRAPRNDIVELEGLRERLQALRGEPSPDHLRLVATDELTMATVLSVQQTSASCGFWRTTWVLGERQVEILTRVPGVDFREHEAHSLFVSLEPGNEEFAELFAPVPEEGEPEPPRFALRHPKATADPAKLADLVAEACRKTPCGTLLLESPGSISLGRARAIISAATSTSGPLLLSLVRPDGAKETWARMHGGKTRPPGRLDADVIQGVVRARYDELRTCYRSGLARDPRLRGTVSTRFLIAEDGSVESVSNAGGDLTDEAVVRCIHDAFAKLQFPAPEGGVVSVVYPIAFDP